MDEQEKKFDNEKLETDSLNEDDCNNNSAIEIYTGQEQLESNINDDQHTDDDKTIDYFISEDVWDKIGKELKDYDENDMDLLKWKSLEDCIEFYYTYAKIKRFRVRIGPTVKSRNDGHVISKTLVCRKEGYRDQKWNNLPNRKREPKPISRVGCEALIQFKLHERYHFWKVEKFYAQYCHVMVKPTQVPYIRSFQKISEVDKIKINTMHNSGIAPNRMMRNFVNESGSLENVSFIQKDLYNYIQRIKREEVQDGDAETVMAYLFGKQETDPLFFVSHTRDEHRRLEKLFWCDGTSRIDYKEFGQVLAFDTTYKCNAYNKPFVVLVGVNHHRNTILFGCALVVNEKTDTYVWVLQQLIAAGDGYKPLTVITDGDKAMANAIAQVLPKAKHRLCLWHLMRNVKSNGNKTFHDGFMKCVDNCRTPSDFERAWTELVRKHKFEDREWVKDLYEVKEKWAEAYMRGYFYAAMRTTQRCESMNRTLKTLLDKKVMLYQFVKYYYKELESLRWEEGRQDYKTTDEQPYCDGVLETLKMYASQVYTRNYFATLCKEMSYEGYYLVKRITPHNGCIFYSLEHGEKENLWYLIVKDITHETMYCCCMKLESVGFPCRHMFAVLKYEKAKEIPRGCIMKRWTIYAKKDAELQKNNENMDGDNSAAVQARYSILTSFSMNICHRASQTLQTFNEVKDQFVKMRDKLQAVKVGCKKRKNMTNGELLGIGDPLILETRRGKPKKMKGQASSSNKPSVEEETIDLNKTPTLSPNKLVDQDMNNTDALQLSKIAMCMPNTYKEGDISKASYNHELKNMDDNPTIFDWQPNTDW